jgi:hypothetical protein
VIKGKASEMTETTQSQDTTITRHKVYISLTMQEQRTKDTEINMSPQSQKTKLRLCHFVFWLFKNHKLGKSQKAKNHF